MRNPMHENWQHNWPQYLATLLLGLFGGGKLVGYLANMRIKLSEQAHTAEQGARDDMIAELREARTEARISREEALKWWQAYTSAALDHIKEIRSLEDRHKADILTMQQKIDHLEQGLGRANDVIKDLLAKQADFLEGKMAAAEFTSHVKRVMEEITEENDHLKEEVILLKGEKGDESNASTA